MASYRSTTIDPITKQKKDKLTWLFAPPGSALPIIQSNAMVIFSIFRCHQQLCGSSFFSAGSRTPIVSMRGSGIQGLMYNKLYTGPVCQWNKPPRRVMWMLRRVIPTISTDYNGRLDSNWMDMFWLLVLTTNGIYGQVQLWAKASCVCSDGWESKTRCEKSFLVPVFVSARVTMAATTPKLCDATSPVDDWWLAVTRETLEA